MLIYDALLFKSETHFVSHWESVQCTCFYMVLTPILPLPTSAQVGKFAPRFWHLGWRKALLN